MPRSATSAAVIEEDAAPERVLSRRVLVTVRRDAMTNSARVVWAHEIPILEDIFGEGNVAQVDAAALDEGFTKKPSAELMPFNKQQDEVMPPSQTSRIGWVFIGNAGAEWARLERAYGRHHEVPMPYVEHVYGRIGEGKFRAIVGRPRLEDCPDAQLRECILNYGYSLPLATHDSDDAERKASREAWAKFRALGHDELVALAKQVGVEVG
jgi:hypothetical protein